MIKYVKCNLLQKVLIIHVKIKTQDTRNIGQIHISKLTEKRIEKCEDAVKIGDIFQAKIISDDYFDSKYGWLLTRIFQRISIDNYVFGSILL